MASEIQKMFMERCTDELADELLVEQVYNDMEVKLEKKRKEGRGGWHSGSCSNQELMKLLMAHIHKGDMIDVINLAAMIHVRRKLYGESA